MSTMRSMLAVWFNQTFELRDLAIVLLLILMEGILSVDNALVLGLLARRLPVDQREKALTYGLVGAFVFRFIAIAVAAFLLKWTVFKLLGGGYLLYVAVKHFASAKPPDPDTGIAQSMSPSKFWPTVVAIELTDVAFAVDSIVAAMGFVDPVPATSASETTHPKLWVVMLGGFIGVVLMRFAALLFIRLLEKFPRFETAGYLLVALIGSKLLTDWLAHKAEWDSINFHSPASAAFWAFWIGMVLCVCIGFIPKKAADVRHIGTVT